MIGWVLLGLAASHYASYWWAVLALGTTFLVLVIVGVVLYLIISVKEIGLNQRQSNFIDSVTHELKADRQFEAVSPDDCGGMFPRRSRPTLSASCWKT